MEKVDAQGDKQATQGSERGLLPAQHWLNQVSLDISLTFSDHRAETQWEALPEEQSESDSLVNSTLASSITSSILKYRTIQGRKYHSESGNAQYWYLSLSSC